MTKICCICLPVLPAEMGSTRLSRCSGQRGTQGSARTPLPQMFNIYVFCRQPRKMRTNLDVRIEAHNQEGTHQNCSCHRQNL